MSHGFRPPGKVTKHMSIWKSYRPQKSVKIFTDFKAFMVYGVLLWTIFIFL